MSNIEIPIPKDIRDYEPKLVGPFTVRKLGCTVIAGICSYVIYLFQQIILGIEHPEAVPCIIAAIPAASFIFEPYGLKMENYLKAIKENGINKNRIYNDRNILSDFDWMKTDEENEDEEDEQNIIETIEMPKKIPDSMKPC